MKIEHKLSPAMAAAVARVLEQIRQMETERLAALGRAKEAEMGMLALRQAISEQLAIVQETEGLPAPVAPYRLNAEGTALIGDIPDPPAAAPIAAGELAPIVELKAAPAAAGPVNGIDHA